MRRNWIVIAVLVVVLGFMAWTAFRQSRSGASAATLTGNADGRIAPDFALTDVKTGNVVHLSDFRGKAVLLNFWATWCPPCKMEIPWFVDLQKQYGPQGFVVLGVAMDDAGRDTILKFANEMNINYPVLQGTEAVGDEYGGVDSLPTSFYIDREGKIVNRVLGLRSHGEVEANIQRALSEGQQHALLNSPAVPAQIAGSR